MCFFSILNIYEPSVREHRPGRRGTPTFFFETQTNQWFFYSNNKYYNQTLINQVVP